MKINLDNKIMEIKVATSFCKRLFGLMFKKNISYGVLFPKTKSIHTFFMRENINVYALDENNILIKKHENMRPWHIFYCKHKKTSILELPINASLNLNIGDKINLYK